MAEKIQLSIAQLQKDLREGHTREEIRVKYGLKKSTLASVFKHPKLKGLKTHKTGEAVYNLVDDVDGAATQATAAKKNPVAKKAPVAKTQATNLVDDTQKEETATVDQKGW